MVEKYVVVCCWATMCSPSHLCIGIGIGIGIGAHCSLVEFRLRKLSSINQFALAFHVNLLSCVHTRYDCTYYRIERLVIVFEAWDWSDILVAVLDICSISIYIPYELIHIV